MTIKNVAIYESSTYRETFILGERTTCEKIWQNIASLGFMQLIDKQELMKPRESNYFVIAICDFSDKANMQIVARALSKIDGVNAHKIIYSKNPTELDQQHLLFSVELDVRHVSYGIEKDKDLRDYLKRVTIDQPTLNLRKIENEISKAERYRDYKKLKSIADQLSEMKETEEILRLRVTVANARKRPKNAITYLGRLLKINPQNLWAANLLGSLYLKSGKIAEGIEALERLSQFHDLNSERCLSLGNAYLDAGQFQKAQNKFEQGQSLIGDDYKDSRFQEGMAKVSLMKDRDLSSALSLLGKPVLSESVLAFLNMRAILATKNNQFVDGLRYYNMALDGCHEDKLTRSRLHFNIGLAHLKLDDLESAIKSFEHSIGLGGEEFQRAVRPLEIAKKMLKKAQSENGSESTETVDHPYEVSDLAEVQLNKKLVG